MTPDPLQREFDVIVIGAGAVGENVADRVVQGGLTAVLVEAELVGGECSYWACMPSKALLRPGTALHGAQTVPGAGEAVTRTLDTAAVLRRRDYFTSNWQDDGQAKWVEETGIGLVRGHGWITAPRTVEVAGLDGNTYLLTARHAVVLATGSTPNQPPIDGLSEVQVWGTREATSAREIPERLAVLGGGTAGVELAQAFARLGSAVTLVARSRLLGNFPEEAADLVLAGLRADGVEVHLHTPTRSISENDDGTFTLTLDGGTSVSADQVLVSTGRHPSLEGLGLESVGLGADDGKPLSLATDATGLVAGMPDGGTWLYAAGDAAGNNLLTHQGKYEARATGDAIAARAKGELDGDTGGLEPLCADGQRSTPSRTWSSRTRNLHRWAGLWSGRGRTATTCHPLSFPSRLPDPPCTPSATKAGRSWWWTRTARCSWVPPSPVPTSLSCCTPPPLPWWARSRWTGCGMRSRPTPPSARSGSGCWRSTVADTGWLFELTGQFS